MLKVMHRKGSKHQKKKLLNLKIMKVSVARGNSNLIGEVPNHGSELKPLMMNMN